MRIERLDLAAFGHFTDHVIELGEAPIDGPDLHLVYGPNEAGKSTTLAAVGELLYGMPHRSAWAFRHDNAMLEIGARLDAGAGAFEVRRYKNRLVDGEGGALGPAAIDVHGLSLEEYRARFSLDEKTLERGSDEILAQQGELGAALFSAAAGLADLGQRIDRAMADADAFYRPRKRTEIELLALKERLAAIDRELATRDVDTKAWTELRTATEAARARHAEQETLVATLRGELAALERRLHTHRATERRTRLRARLDAFGPLPDLPASVLETVETDLEARTHVRAELAGLDVRVDELDAELEALAIDELVLDRADEIEALERERVLVGDRRREEPALRDALERSERRCRALLARLELPEDAEPLEVAVPEEVLEGLETLAHERAGLVGARDAAAAALAELEPASDDAAGEAPMPAADEDPPDTTVLARLLERLVERAPRFALDELLRRRDELSLTVSQELDTLSPWQGDAAALGALVPPEPRELDALGSRTRELEERERALGKEERRLRDRLGQVAEERAALADIDRVDDARLAALREARGTRLEALREAIERGAESARLRTELDALERALATLDEIAEARLARSDALARARALEAERAALERAHERLAVEREEHSIARHALGEEIAAIATVLGLEGATLGFLVAWRQRRVAALERVAVLREAETRLAQARRDARAHAEPVARSLAPFLSGADATALVDCPLEDLIALARETLGRAERARERLARSRDERARHDAERVRHERALAVAEERLERWEARWVRAIEGRAAFAGDVEVTIARLRPWGELGREARTLDERQAAVCALDGALGEFQRHAGAMLDALDVPPEPHAADGAGREAESPAARVVALKRRLDNARRAADRAEEKRSQLARLRTERERVRERLDPVERRVETLRERCAAEDVAALPAIVKRLRECVQDREALAETERELAEALGTNDIDDALAADEALDRDALEAEIAVRRERLDAERRELSERFAALKNGERELATLDDNAAVATLQAERANLLHEIETRALDTLGLRLGRLALEAGLNRFRERHRSGMMEHARRAFVALTDGQFTDLRARPDERGRDRLVGVRADGGVLDTARMSTGTRFQLFLALRVAAWHEYADKRRPLPFVADDILESFDERRTAAALSLMAEMARRGQVIYLTHHRHLIDIARGIDADVRVHELPPRAGGAEPASSPARRPGVDESRRTHGARSAAASSARPAPTPLEADLFES